VTRKRAQDEARLRNEAEWAEVAIVSHVHCIAGSGDENAAVTVAPGEKCARCWKVLPEVGSVTAHPGLCLRCVEVVA